MQSLLVLGRQPALGLAEVESLYGANKLRPVGQQAVVVDVDPCLLAFNRLGGSIKFCKLLTTLDTTKWKEIEAYLVSVSPEHSQRLPEGKLLLGLNAIGLDVEPRQLQASGLSIKKAIRNKTGRSVRVIPNKSQQLSSAQVLHNRLTGPMGWELVIIRDNNQTILAQTVMVQDIESYSRRDRDRPKRDSRVGMLPPKLAQIIINLAAGELEESALSSICDIPANEPIPLPILNETVLDPFCGTGVVLQEATLMGYKAVGSDLEPRMVEYSKINLDWLARVYGLESFNLSVEVGDATNHRWTDAIDCVASETYLGRTFTRPPETQILNQTAADCNLIIKKFLKNIHGQLKPGTRLCLAIPAWQVKPDQFKFLPLIDQISELGYNRVVLEHVGNEDLVYYRSEQIVARQLLLITRK